MKQTLFIGSTCVDIILNIKNLPAPGQDENIIEQSMSVGGCAFNASTVLRQFKLPYKLCSPVGSGIYGNFIEQKFKELEIPVFVRTPEIENGCCYCIIEKNGRRTFLSKHGAEYRFDPSWFFNVDFVNVDGIYFCGLEIEDIDGKKIVSFLEKTLKDQNKTHSNISLFFAPGPRINSIDKRLLSNIFNLEPVLHLNDEEALSFTKTKSVHTAAETLFSFTHNSVVITQGKEGAFCYDKALKKAVQIPCRNKVNAVDTTGAGDCHCGAMIAGLKQGLSLFDSVERANVFASAIVTQSGSTLSDTLFNRIAETL
ncbi:bifunctional hydroxymethylpyrimidine kinase/phosphomethylpyrimidine kinase [Treponema parvum]|uniref:Bifunctional hydroxymethylpyrimidine kinase/phosphomethylpyrimidine kinase n=1 Tax=Treponema parvum TaxID=138851 RepID=A0A975F0C2_9SPIR|nr:PfkB family carbohydrate kinase [Treponema parvum]QTQ12018.1 bifunctional hydroxymethylpyrimidine kinase/phosphomethylpyrimidine kinase [Treponema parvum]